MRISDWSSDVCSSDLLVNYAFPKDDVVDEAHKIATEIAGNPLWAVRWSKAAVNKQLKAQLNQILELSIAYESLTMLTEDSKAAVNAFADKRTPQIGRASCRDRVCQYV